MNDPTTHLNIRQETLIDKNFASLFLFVIWMMGLYDTYAVFFQTLANLLCAII